MTTFSGPAAVNVFVAMTLKSGIRLYAKTGMRPNRMWTPSAMMRKAAEITGKKFRPRDYELAVAALADWIDAASKEGITN